MISRLILLPIVVLLGLVTGYLSLQVWRAARSPHWPTTQGSVIAFYETPSYRYSVEGTSYTNDYTSCNELFSRLWSARNSQLYSVRYPLNTTVLVHFCPGNPAIAVLETKLDSSGLILLAGLALMTAIAGACLVAGPRRGLPA